jgi:pilus assembly protein CpaB
MKQKLIPIIAVVIGIIAFILTSQYLKAKIAEVEKAKQLIYKNAKKVEVVIAQATIPSGTTITESDLTAIGFFEAQLPDRVVLKNEGRLGKKTTSEIKAGKPVLWDYISGGPASHVGLAPKIKPGMRAISLPINGANAVSGMILPNNQIDVLGTFTMPVKANPNQTETVTLTILQDVSVIAVGQTMADQAYDAKKSRTSSSGSITLEVTPKEAELLVFAQQLKGALTLSLRNPGDPSFEKDLPEINFDKMEKSLPELNTYRQKQIRFKKTL